MCGLAGQVAGLPCSLGECLHSCLDSLQSADSVPVGVGDVGLLLKVCEHGARLEVVPEAPHAARCPLLYHLVLSKELQCSTLNQQLEAGVGGVSLSSCL